MAQWSKAAIDKRVEEKRAALLAERMTLLKKCRAAGWKVQVLDPASDRSHILAADGEFLSDGKYLGEGARSLPGSGFTYPPLSVGEGDLGMTKGDGQP